MFRQVTTLLFLVAFLAPVIVFAEPSPEEKEVIIKELGKDLAELNELVTQLQQQLKKMTPEERKQWCKDMQAKMEKSPPSIPIQFNCD